MGLGKTLTMISLVARHKQTRKAAEADEKDGWISRDKQLEKCT